MARLWKWVVGYEGLYMVSDAGDVLNLTGRKKRGEMLKRSIGRAGYLTVHLRKDGKSGTANVHKLVAEAFLPNPEQLPEIDHINGDKRDCRVGNLEWVSSKENKRRARMLGLWKPTWLGKQSPTRKPVLMDGMTFFGSLSEASDSTGIALSQISKAANGHSPAACGHKFEFV